MELAARVATKLYIPKQKPFRVTPWNDEVPRPPKGLEFLSIQPTAVRFVLERERCYLALEQGLGKTICAATIARVFKKAIVYLCPPFLVENVVNEFKRWSPELKVGVYGKPMVSPPGVLIIPDSILIRGGVYDDVVGFLRYWGEFISILIVDEAHRYKNDTAKRTKALFGYASKLPTLHTEPLTRLFNRVVLMSGTPMPNSPIEMYGVFHNQVPELIGNMDRFRYGKRYCNAYRKGKFGWDYSGSSNEAELQRRIIYPKGQYMLRIRKDSIDLPPKIESVFVVSDKMSPRLAALDKKIGQNYDADKDPLKAALQLEAKADIHAMSYRRMLGLEKVRHALPYYENLMSDTKEKIIIFAHHTEVIDELSKALKKFNPLVITGQTPVSKRQHLVNQFQREDRYRIFIGNYKAMGVGFTLTAAERVLFHEFDYVPGTNNQASDRAHRIGQNKTVYVEYIVYQDSLDKKILEAVLKKSKSIAKILEG